MSADDAHPLDKLRQFAAKQQATPAGPPPTPAPTPHQLLADELNKVERRIRKVIKAGRANFHDGSSAYDTATVAASRLAALFETGSPVAALLESVSDADRQGLSKTRNISAHHGYDEMDDDVFWDTVTERMPTLIAAIRRANRLD